jgi:hypothetical protein
MKSNLKLYLGWANLCITSASSILVSMMAIKYLDSDDARRWLILYSAWGILFLADGGVVGTLSRITSIRYAEVVSIEVRINFFELIYINIKRYYIAWLFGFIAGLAYFYKSEEYSGESAIREVCVCWSIMAISAVLQCRVSRIFAVIDGIGEMHYTRLMQTGLQLSGLVGVFLSLVLTKSLTVMVSSWVISQAVAAVFIGRFSKKLLNNSIKNDLISKNKIEKIYKSEINKMWMLSIGSVMSQLMVLPVLNFSGAKNSVTEFFFLQRIFSVCSMAVSMIALVVRPKFIINISKGERLESRRIAIGAAKKSWLLTIMLAIAITSTYFLCVRYNIVAKKYIATSAVFFIMLADYFISCSTSVLGQFVIAYGRNPFAKSVFVNGILTAILLYLLVPIYGALGGALSIMLAGVISTYWLSAFEFYNIIESLKYEA